MSLNKVFTLINWYGCKILSEFNTKMYLQLIFFFDQIKTLNDWATNIKIGSNDNLNKNTDVSLNHKN